MVRTMGSAKIPYEKDSRKIPYKGSKLLTDRDPVEIGRIANMTQRNRHALM
jgi:hypothetical protein